MSQTSTRLPYGDGREALLEAVIAVVAEKGLRGVTYRAVAGKAGVNHTLVAHHFGSIEGLLAATMEWAAQRSIGETGLDRVVEFDESFANSLMQSILDAPELQVFQFEMILQSRRDEKIRVLVENLYMNYNSAIERALERRGLAVIGEIASAIFAAFDGLMLQLLTIGDEERIREAVVGVGRLVSLLERSAAGEEG
ncbi:TetR/AcrR family transcriptional regulator [Glutamicibacter sp. X7]